MHKALELKQQIDFQLRGIVAEYAGRFSKGQAEAGKCVESFLQCYGREIGQKVAQMTRETLLLTVLEGVDDQQAVTNHVINASSTVVHQLRHMIAGALAA